jgi:hypothetical protein
VLIAFRPPLRCLLAVLSLRVLLRDLSLDQLGEQPVPQQRIDRARPCPKLSVSLALEDEMR